MDHLKIEYLPIDDLKPYDRNAKEHPQKQIDQIIESIKQFGCHRSPYNSSGSYER